MSIKAIVFDLDDTLVDTSELRHLRTNREWKAAVAKVNSTRMFDGLGELLAHAKKRSVSVAIVTTSVSHYASAVLRHHGITYDCLVAYHDAPRKPKPDGVLEALNRLKVAPADAIGIGDLDTDCTAYHLAGLQAIGAAWSKALEASRWDHIARHPREITKYFV